MTKRSRKAEQVMANAMKAATQADDDRRSRHSEIALTSAVSVLGQIGHSVIIVGVHDPVSNAMLGATSDAFVADLTQAQQLEQIEAMRRVLDKLERKVRES